MKSTAAYKSQVQVQAYAWGDSDVIPSTWLTAGMLEVYATAM